MQTDSQLRDDVLCEIDWRPNLDSSHIGVTAKDGIVTLTGRVTYLAAQISAVSAAESVYGVRAVANDIEVEILDIHKRNDSDIAKAVAYVLKWNVEIPIDKISAVVKHGWVTLKGEADWQFQKNAAQHCVDRLMGVTGVTNEVLIKSSSKWVDVKNKIEEAFKRNADLQNHRVSISTNHDTVTLTGSVTSSAERNQALRATWASPGVKSVINHITIVPC